ncbi:MAG: ribosome silencing factor [Balneolaceae bacterium]|nr:ribosome silencing factor [Balneolaceae bacterium]
MPESAQQFSTRDDSKTTDSQRLVEVITNALLEKKAEEVAVLDVHELTTLADQFVVCHASSDVQIKALADNVNRCTSEELGEKAWKEEGRDTRRWVILDYVNVVVHIFRKELREYYALERMWNDAEITRVSES